MLGNSTGSPIGATSSNDSDLVWQAFLSGGRRRAIPKNPSGIIASMSRLLTERERKALRQQVKPLVQTLALLGAIVLVLAGVTHFVGLPATEIALNIFLQAAGLVLFFQASLLFTVGLIVAWRFVIERQGIAEELRNVVYRLDLRATKWARRWSKILEGAWFPVRLPAPPDLRLVWQDRVAIIGSGFVAGESPQLE